MNSDIRRYNKLLQKIRALREPMTQLSDKELSGLTEEFRRELEAGKTLEDILPRAFAAMCEADRRVLGMDPFDVQIIGGLALHEGCLAEMATGEGKTLVATLPMYLNAITGEGAILVTNNEYLAIRDYEEMGPVYRFMGLTVSVGVRMKTDETLTNDEKREVYNADVIYTTYGSLGFDYLFNNLVTSAADRFMRPFHYVVIDEADSVLLDAAQTPLVVSGSPRVQSNLYQMADMFVSLLVEDVHYEKEDQKVWLTEEGVAYAEKFFQVDNIYDDANFEINRHVVLALRAHTLFLKGKDYTISNKGELTLLDGGTGRVLPGVKLRGGQHQALEVKERILDSRETRSVASITYQNLFQLFPKMSGMSGTIADAREELMDVYGLKVVVIPTNRPVIRHDQPDVYFHTEEEKFDAAIKAALRMHRRGRPVLIVASTIAETEKVSKVLIQKKIPHNVLNANNAFWEASIIKEAGRLEAVTVATAMAGRGTDIKLGKGVEKFGGLAVIGIGRMANTRMERQVRGRAGRQGDPGDSRFFVALTDEVVKRNQIAQVEKIIEKEKTVSKRRLKHIINRAQALEEEYAVMSRRTSVDYDQVLKKQRLLIYQLRNDLLDGGTIQIPRLLEIADELICRFLNGEKELDKPTVNRFLLDNISYHSEKDIDRIPFDDYEAVKDYLLKRTRQTLDEQTQRIGTQKAMQAFVRIAALTAIDEAWVDQVDYLLQLQAAVTGRSSAQRNVVYEFQNEAMESYRKMEYQIKRSIIRNVLLSDVYLDEKDKLHIVFP